MGLRERKKAATRAALSWAAIRLTVERGVDGFTVDDIAAAAGVSPRTFNNYFSSKAEAIASRHLDRLRRCAAELRRRPAAEPLWDALTAAVLTLVEPGPEVLADPVASAAGLGVMVAEPALQGEFLRAGSAARAEIAAAVAGRTGTDDGVDLYPNLVAAAVLAVCDTVTDHHLRTASSVPVEQLLTEGLAMVAAGLPEPLRSRPLRSPVTGG